jgi:hypothetical protein
LSTGKFGEIIEGCGIGILLTLGLTWKQLSSYHLDLYHRQLPVTTVVRAIAIDLLLVSLLGVVVLWLLRRFDPEHRTLLWGVLAAGLAARAVGGLITAEILTRQGVTPLRVFAVFMALLGVLWIFARWLYRPVMRGFRVVLMLLGFSIFWVVPQLLSLSFARQPQDRVAFARAVSKQVTPHRRIVWLLFDEMSQDQLVDHRWPGLAMPNFDRLRAQSVTFSKVMPDGYYTEEVLPSLLLGQPVAAIKSSVAGELFVRHTQGAAWQAFNGNSTLFADAQRKHQTTGLVGTYNPYCRLLAQQVDSCWTQLLLFDDHLSGQKSTLENVAAPMVAAWRRTFHLPVEHTPTNTEKFDAMMVAAQDLIRNEDIDFVFIHLPIPHPPGTYDRRTGRIVAGGSYFDNMALSDRTLGVLQAALAQTSSAAMTTLIVSSDHSWRVPLWRHAIGWTAEDEKASQGRFDSRPLLMVHLAGETAPLTMDRPFPALAEHDLMEKLFAEPLDPDELVAWAGMR